MECRQCGKECLSIRDLDRHRRTSHIIASCEQCARPFYNPQGAIIFIVSETNLQRYRLVEQLMFKLFNGIFTIISDLDKHLKNVHHIGQKEDEFICELCAQKFQTKQYLRYGFH